MQQSKANTSRRFLEGYAAVLAASLLFPSVSMGVAIDLTDATPSVTGPTTLHLAGIATLGSNYRADFQWNARTNKFDVSNYEEMGNQPPEAEILFPRDGDVFTENEEVHLSGRGTDPEDGRLIGDALAWTSDVEGELGNGEELEGAAGRLRLGSHILTLTVTDSGNSSHADSIQITIEEGPNPEGFVPIEAGTFIMGSPEDELGRQLVETQHEVTLTRDFYLSVTEVTQGQWVEVMGKIPATSVVAMYARWSKSPGMMRWTIVMPVRCRMDWTRRMR